MHHCGVLFLSFFSLESRAGVGREYSCGNGGGRSFGALLALVFIVYCQIGVMIKALSVGWWLLLGLTGSFGSCDKQRDNGCGVRIE